MLQSLTCSLTLHAASHIVQLTVTMQLMVLTARGGESERHTVQAQHGLGKSEQIQGFS